MAQIFLNNCYATLAQAITATDTQIELSGMNGFPSSLGEGDFFLLTLYADDSRYGSNIEVVKVTGLSGTTLTVERGYEEGTFAHVAGERVEARLTATTLDRIDQPNDWPSITNKPTEFPPVAHGHTWAEVTSKPNTATRWPTWNEVQSKPSVFTPSNHSHNASDITSGVFSEYRLPSIPINKLGPPEYNAASHDVLYWEPSFNEWRTIAGPFTLRLVYSNTLWSGIGSLPPAAIIEVDLDTEIENAGKSPYSSDFYELEYSAPNNYTGSAKFQYSSNGTTWYDFWESPFGFSPGASDSTALQTSGEDVEFILSHRRGAKGGIYTIGRPYSLNSERRRTGFFYSWNSRLNWVRLVMDADVTNCFGGWGKITVYKGAAPL